MPVRDRQFRFLHSPHFLRSDSTLSPRRNGTEFCLGTNTESWRKQAILLIDPQ